MHEEQRVGHRTRVLQDVDVRDPSAVVVPHSNHEKEPKGEGEH